MGQHCIICNFPCDDDVLFCPECVEAKEIYEKIKKRFILDNLQDLTL